MNEDQISFSALFDTGSVIDGKWVLIERIGKGGMGEVFRAHQLNLKRDIALKVLSGDTLQDIDENPEEVANAIQRLRIEVQTMARVRHPNVLQIYDYGSVEVRESGIPGKIPYIAMEYVPGNTLRYTMSDEGFDDEEGLLADWLTQYFLPVLDGIEAIHSHDIIHRDIKPANILMDGDTPKITDFGLARSSKLRAVSNSWDVKGTAPYMAPEQFSDFRRARIPADIYSLGKILFEAVSGQLDPKQIPFQSVSLEDPATPFFRDVDKIIRTATDEQPNNRYQSASEMRQAVRNALDTRHRARKTPDTAESTPAYVRRLWAGIIAVLIALGGMTIYHLLPHTESGGMTDPAVSPPDPKTIKSPSAPLPTTRIAKDGREMKLVPATDRHPAFYTDPALVTFHHYAEFLNEVKASLTVEDGVVRRGEDILLYLGDGNAPSDQFLYRHSRFHLRQTEWAPRPVTRVSFLGAAAYARHYGKKLPSYEQWQSIAEQLGESDLSPTNETQRPVMESLREWLTASPSNGSRESFILDRSAGDSKIKQIKRAPWEGFYDVGFRTVRDVGKTRNRL